MFRVIANAISPIKKRLFRALASETTAENNNAFQRNSLTKEQQLSDILKRTMPGITYISIEDISGGCGAMYEISIEAKEFSGISRVKQHRLVTDALKSEIAEMHGIRIHTKPSADDKK